jgi:hypothetical protein
MLLCQIYCTGLYVVKTPVDVFWVINFYRPYVRHIAVKFSYVLVYGVFYYPRDLTLYKERANMTVGFVIASRKWSWPTLRYNSRITVG